MERRTPPERSDKNLTRLRAAVRRLCEQNAKLESANAALRAAVTELQQTLLQVRVTP